MTSERIDMSGQSARQSGHRCHRALFLALAAALSLAICLPAVAGPREQVKRIHDRLTGVPPTEQFLSDHEAMVGTNPAQVALDAMAHPAFYNVTLKNFATPWTNEDQTVFAPLNDYTATVIGMIRDDRDFREVLYGNYVYVGNVSPAPSPSSNAHYEALENQGIDLSQTANLSSVPQSSIYGIPDSATAGVMTTRAASRAFFYGGTNRAMFRFTMMNHLCTDLEPLKDITITPDRIRQDVSRSPGGDSRIFLNSCVGCHAGMDGLTGAFAYYEWVFSGDPDSGQLVYDSVTPLQESTINPNYPDGRHKYLINENNFKYGFVTVNDSWVNYWRKGQNAVLGWDSALPATGNGAKTLGEELANTDAFAGCQAKKVFKTVCLRDPVGVNAQGDQDSDVLATMVARFESSGNMKDLFAQAAVHCMGQ
jgi:hypothetical protein